MLTAARAVHHMLEIEVAAATALVGGFDRRRRPTSPAVRVKPGSSSNL
jgi:hypothetical protein